MLARGHRVEGVPVGRDDAGAKLRVDKAGETTATVLALDVRPDGSLQVAGGIGEQVRVSGQHVHSCMHDLFLSAGSVLAVVMCSGLSPGHLGQTPCRTAELAGNHRISSCDSDNGESSRITSRPWLARGSQGGSQGVEASTLGNKERRGPLVGVRAGQAHAELEMPARKRRTAPRSRSTCTWARGRCAAMATRRRGRYRRR